MELLQVGLLLLRRLHLRGLLKEVMGPRPLGESASELLFIDDSVI